MYQDLWFRMRAPTCFSPQLYMVQSAWAWASSVMSAPPPMVLGRDRNSRAEATLFFIKSITWTSLKLHVMSLFLVQVELGTVLHQEKTWIGEQIVDQLPLGVISPDITATWQDYVTYCYILYIIFLPLASIICFGFLSCIFWQELIRWAEKVYQIAEEIGLNEVGLTIKGIESWNRQTLWITIRIVYVPT